METRVHLTFILKIKLSKCEFEKYGKLNHARKKVLGSSFENFMLLHYLEGAHFDSVTNDWVLKSL